MLVVSLWSFAPALAAAEPLILKPKSGNAGIFPLDIQVNGGALELLYVNLPRPTEPGAAGKLPAIELARLDLAGRRLSIGILPSLPTEDWLGVGAALAGPNTVLRAGALLQFYDRNGGIRGQIDLERAFGLPAKRLSAMGPLVGTGDGGVLLTLPLPRESRQGLASEGTLVARLGPSGLQWRAIFQENGARTRVQGLWGWPGGGALVLVEVGLIKQRGGIQAVLSGDPTRRQENRLMLLDGSGQEVWRRILGALGGGMANIAAQNAIVDLNLALLRNARGEAVLFFVRFSGGLDSGGPSLLPVARDSRELPLKPGLDEAGLGNVSKAALGPDGRIYVFGQMRTMLSGRTSSYVAEVTPAGGMSAIRLLPLPRQLNLRRFERIGTDFVFVSLREDPGGQVFVFDLFDESLPLYAEKEAAAAEDVARDLENAQLTQQAQQMADRMMSQMGQMFGMTPEQMQGMSREEQGQAMQAQAERARAQTAEAMQQSFGLSQEQAEAMDPEEKQRLLQSNPEGMAKMMEAMNQIFPGLMPQMAQGQDAAAAGALPDEVEPLVAVLPPPAPDAGFPDGSETLAVAADFSIRVYHANLEGRRLLLVIFDTLAGEVLHRVEVEGPLDERFDLRSFDAQPGDLLFEIIDADRQRVLRRLRPALVSG